MNKLLKFISGASLVSLAAFAQNLIQNPSYEFHQFTNHRSGSAANHTANTVAFWSHDTFGDVTVQRESHANASKRPEYSVGNIVTLKPGKKFWQLIPLAEVQLAHGDEVSFTVAGWQSAPNAAAASIELLKLDSEDGTWSPADYGCGDKRTFPKHARGNFVVAKAYTATADANGMFRISIPAAKIEGHFTVGKESHTADMNTVALRVVLQNKSEKDEAHFWAPSLTRGNEPLIRNGIVKSDRAMEPVFTCIPKTMQKLWRGESLHIILMGSSIDRGSANPPMYPFDENPESPTFKQPIGDRIFEGEKVGRKDLDGYFGWWQHYFSYGGQLRMELMRRFNLPASKICLNIMASDGSCIAEATSGLEEYCTLSTPPKPDANGHKEGCKWEELYPELFTRPQGPGPDLIIYGSGANEKTDTPDEGAIFEASIRWIQQRYPDAEFLFCQFQNRGAYTPNPGDLMAIAMRYQIPFMDYGKLCDDTGRWCNGYALVPIDGHPQEACHKLWAYTLEKAFECWDPVPAGKAQLRLPSRIYDTAIGWEGYINTYKGDSPRIRNGRQVILDDTTINFWAALKDDSEVFVDGAKSNVRARKHNWNKNGRNSAFRWGRLSLGDRHIVELSAQDPENKISFVDMKVVNNRNYYAVTSAFWKKNAEPAKFESQWGAPYGSDYILIKPGETAEISIPATDLSIAYIDDKEAGTLVATVDGVEKLKVAANVPFKTLDEQENFLENRKGIRRLPFGIHKVTVTAQDAPVKLLGIFTYDTRPNLDAQRTINGVAVPDEPVRFTPPFKATPIVHAFGGLKVKELTKESVTFSGSNGSFTAIGE